MTTSAVDGFKGRLDSSGVRGVDALVDRQCLAKVGDGLIVPAVTQRAVTEALKSAGLVQRDTDGTGDAERCDESLVSRCRRVAGQRQLAEMVEDLGLPVAVSHVLEQLKSLPKAGGGGRMVPGGEPHQAKDVQGASLAVPIAKLPAQFESLPSARSGSGVITRCEAHQPEQVRSAGLTESTAELPAKFKRLPSTRRCRRVLPSGVLDVAENVERAGLTVPVAN